jgi:hypothetical protein
MVVRMPALRRTKSGSWSSRKAIPRDVQDAYRARYGVRHEAKFHAPASCPRPTARTRHLEWQAEVYGRIAAIRAEQRGEGQDLTRREARALAGEWYRRYVNQHEENPRRPRGWAKLREILFLLLEDIAGDPETLEIHMEAPAVRKEIDPRLADEAKTAQFLASKGEALTPAAMAMFLDALIDEFLQAADLLRRRAAGDCPPDQHLQTLTEYRRQSAPQSAAGGATATRYGARSTTRSGKTATQLFAGYSAARGLAAETIARSRVVCATLDEYLAGRNFDALSDQEAQRLITSLVTDKRSAGTVKRNWLAALKAMGRWAVKRHHITSNPFEVCTVPVPKKRRGRQTKARDTGNRNQGRGSRLTSSPSADTAKAS